MSIVSIKNLNVSVGTNALLHDISLEINKSEIVALVGESGSGKTLTALSVMSLLPQGLKQKGDITIQDEAFRTNMRGNSIGMIFQEPMTSLNPLHKIGKQIAEAITIHQKLSHPVVKERVQQLLDSVGLAHFKDRLDTYPHQLSGGERQRVMIAMAIANNPALLIADEPTTALDVTIQTQILTLLKELQKKLGMAVLLITHDLSIVRKIADRVVIMTEGKIVETRTTADIFNNPTHSYTKHLLASEPKNKLQIAPANAPVLMECKNLCVSFAANNGLLSWNKHPIKILNDVTLSLAKGTTLGIVGESGSGKTTLALALLKLIKSEGEIVFEKNRIDSLSGKNLRSIRRNMQMVFQDPYSSLNPRMAIGDIIREGLDVHEQTLTYHERNEMVGGILKEVGLTPDMHERYPHEFSGGQRQRISIARALILKPSLIILDEPTSALDISVQAQILDLLQNLQQKHGISYIFISHDLRTIRAISHTILVMQKGRVVEFGTAEQIFTAPKNDYTQKLLKAAL